MQVCLRHVYTGCNFQSMYNPVYTQTLAAQWALACCASSFKFLCIYTGTNDVIYGDYDLSERLNAASGLGDEDFADLKTGEIYVSFQILCGTRHAGGVIWKWGSSDVDVVILLPRTNL